MATGTATIVLSVKQRQALRDIDRFKNKLSGIGRVAGTVTAALGGIGLAAAGWKALMTAARFEELGIVMEVVAKNVGVPVQSIRELDQAVRDTGMTAEASRMILIRFMQQNLDLAKAVDFAKASQLAAIPAMMDSSQAAMQGIEGIVRLMPRMLRTAGFYTQLESEMRKMAQASGRVYDDLTMQEKQQMALDLAIQSTTELTGIYEAAMAKAGKQIRSFTGRELKNLFAAIGDVGLPALEALINALRRVTQDVIDWASANKEVLRQKVADWAKNVSEKAEDMYEWLKKNSNQISAMAQIMVTTAITVKLALMANSIVLVAKALKAVSWASLAAGAGPIGVIAAVVAGVAAAAIAIRHGALDSLIAIRTNAVDAAMSLRELGDRTRTLAEEYRDLASHTKHTTEEKRRLARISDELNGIIPENVRNLLEEEAAARGLASAYDLLVDEKMLSRLLEQVAALEERQEALKKITTKNKKAFEDVQAAQMAGTPRRYLAGRKQYKDYTDAAIELQIVEKQIAEAQADIKRILSEPDLDFEWTPDTGVVNDARDKWAKILDAIHKMRMDAIEDQFEKERIKVTEEFEKLQGLILKGRQPLDLTGDEAAALNELVGIYDTRMAQIEAERTKKAREAANERSKDAIDAVLAELDYKQRLYAWGTQAYIMELRRQVEAYAVGTEERLLLEKELLEKIRDLWVEDADRKRDIVDRGKWDVINTYKTIRTAFVDAAVAGGDAWKHFGDWLLNYFVKIVLTRVLDYIFKIKEAQEGIGGVGGWQGMVLKALSFAVGGLQHGGYVRSPRLAKIAEREPEIVSPIPKMIEAVKEGIRQAGGFGVPTIVIPINEIRGYDAASLLESARGGELGRAIEEAAIRGYLRLQPRLA